MTVHIITFISFLAKYDVLKVAIPLSEAAIMNAMTDLDPILEDVLRKITYHVSLIEVAHPLSDLWRVRLNPATVTQSFENDYLLNVPCYPAPLLQYASIRRMLKMVC